MNRLRFLSLAVIVVCTFLSSYASVEVDGIYYELDSSTMTATVGQFNTCEGEITIPNTVVLKGKTYEVTSIGNFAFANNINVTKIDIPNSVTMIGICAFQYCSGLTSITIPHSVTSIDAMAFYGCGGLNSVVIEGSLMDVGSEIFSLCSSLTSVIIGDSVTTIGFAMFRWCANLVSVTIGNSVAEIGSDAFLGCSGLTSIIIPNSVTLIGKSAFQNCSGLTSVTIPDSVTRIGESAFSSCSGLTSVTIGNSVTEIDNWAFNGCTNIGEIISMNTTPPMCSEHGEVFLVETCNKAVLKIPVGCKETYSAADVWKYFVTIVEITPVNVSTDENSATFEIPTVENAVTYTVNVYSDEAMTQLIATTNYDATGKIIPMSTSLELSIGGFENGTYYYEVVAKSETGETLSNYTGTFEISTSGISSITNEDGILEIVRYDVQGNLLCKPTKGVNIVMMSDGTIRKELVK